MFAWLNDAEVAYKTIQFFEEIGVIRIRTMKVAGRTVKKPEVEYGEVTFRLAA